MNVLIAGGTGFLGAACAKNLSADGHKVIVLTRGVPLQPNQVQWDGITTQGWGHLVNDVDAILNFSGFGTEHWPWSKRQKQRFVDSRVLPARAIASAIGDASRRPRVYVQASGINYYGLRGDSIADESTPPADDFLAQLTVHWENASKPIEGLGVRRVITRLAVVLDQREGLFPLMALPVKMFFGGKFGAGNQSMPWIHIIDQINATRFLLENESAHGVFNLISPAQTANAEFMRGVAGVLKRPYWFHIPTFLLRMTLGEMSVLLTEGRFSQPKRLLELGFQFQYANLRTALNNLLA